MRLGNRQETRGRSLFLLGNNIIEFEKEIDLSQNSWIREAQNTYKVVLNSLLCKFRKFFQTHVEKTVRKQVKTSGKECAT